MARGWESKSVESQQESAQTATADPSHNDAKAKEGERERQGLLLSRAYVLHQIDSSSNERYTESLRKALADLDHKLAQLGDGH